MPYIFAGAKEAVENGTPLMRALVMEFENDPICKGLDKQYMLGDSLLVAPIFNDRSEARFYLPKGNWYDFFGKKTVEGEKYITEKYDYMSIPLFIRENSIVAFGADNSRPDYDFADKAKLFVAPLLENKEANCTVYNKNGVEELKAFAVRKDGKIIIKSEAKKPFTLILAGVEKTENVCGAKAAFSENGVVLTPEKLCGEITVTL
jgi:alpha-D-xyloside xylohydrolase